ncbi:MULTISPECIES: hypothetical protein [Providencia]|uniref:hypothetical protein n=1 Tax=Providencia TaxID=586 RepID=UPI0018E7C4B4|nr:MULTISPECIES: hypothetical protein [Providencia]ELR5252503.1 hypothetical protein [Providencia rettgeri]MBQ0209706.1 hypothetical protein [Providencia rettgeri]MBQ0314195.1 hypothetical protein [Providencia rettgeri]MBQ0322972.1 hypothetical protein [Providencia rettgeri]MBQ0328871.1 hypothetical protein [Providencia rettgeri]
MREFILRMDGNPVWYTDKNETCATYNYAQHMDELVTIQCEFIRALFGDVIKSILMIDDPN